MIDKCQNCGTELKVKSNFCLNCGKAIIDKNNNQTLMKGPASKEPNVQTQQYSPMSSKKSNKKIVVLFIAIIAIIVIIAMMIIFFLGDSSNDQFIGTWNISSDEGSTNLGATITFRSNGDLMGGYMGIDTKFGTWSLEGGKLCLDSTFFGTSLSGKQCMNYTFSNDGNTLTLHDPSGLGSYLVLTKK